MSTASDRVVADRRLALQSFVAAFLVLAGLLVAIWGLYPVFHHPTVRGTNFKIVYPVQQNYAPREVRM